MSNKTNTTATTADKTTTANAPADAPIDWDALLAELGPDYFLVGGEEDEEDVDDEPFLCRAFDSNFFVGILNLHKDAEGRLLAEVRLGYSTKAGQLMQLGHYADVPKKLWPEAVGKWFHYAALLRDLGGDDEKAIESAHKYLVKCDRVIVL